MTGTAISVGIDIAKADVVVACRPDGTAWTATNDPDGMVVTVARLRALTPTLIVLEATGQLAKTDRLDAHRRALVAERVHPTPRPLPDAVLQQLDALMTRRRQLLDMLTAERHRLEHAAAPIRREITRHIRWLERRIGAADRDRDATPSYAPLISAS